MNKHLLKKNSRAYCCMLICLLSVTGSATTVLATEARLVNHVSAKAARFDKVISGRVVDENNQALPGSNVVIKGTTVGTTADADGKFSLSVPDDTQTLVVTYIGYAVQEITIGNRTEINISLQPDLSTLNEVIVVGYGEQRKSDLTGSITSVKGEDLAQLPTQKVGEALQGRAAGVMVLSPSGQPGGPTTIRIRGMNSINGSNQPLIVIDGLQGGDINSLNPNDVESMEILKDASATAIYGSQGANGVILITTKRGKKGAPTINYTYTVGVQQLRKKLDLMDAGDFARSINDNKATLNQPGSDVIVPTPVFTDAQIAQYDKSKGTDWQNEIYRTAPIQTHQLSISGGSDNVQYLVSTGYLNQKGILINSAFQRFSLRANVNVDITKWAKFGVSWAGIKEKGNTPPFGEGASDIDPLGQVVSLAPRWGAVIPVYDELGNYSRHPSGFGEPNSWNPVASGREPFIENNTMRNNLNLYLDFKIAKGLTFRVTGGAVTANRDNYRYLNQKTLDGFKKSGTGYINASEYARYQNSNILTYDKHLGQHHFTVTAVAEQQVEINRGSTTNASGFLVDGAGIFDLGGATTLTASSLSTKRVINSYLGRVNYSFGEKYLLTASYRADGSSVFGANTKWGYFPSVSAAWKLSEESFIRDLGVFSDLKVRGSWGITGNQSISPYATLAQIASGYNYPYTGGDVTDIGFSIIRAANPNLKWESTTQSDLGLDMGLFNGRLTATFDYYVRTTKDLLMSRQLPTYTGFSSIIDNVGKTQNKGLELTIGGDPLVGDFKWNTSFNISGYRAHVVDLGGLEQLPFRTTTGAGYGFSTNNNTALLYLKPGHEFGEMTGWISEGTWKSSEADEAAKYAQLPGDIKYKDVNKDGFINRQDLTIIGHAVPNFIFGFNNRFSYKGFDLNFLITGTQGNDLFNVNRIRLERPGEGTSTALLDRWTPDNQNTDVPAFISQSTRKSSFVGVPAKVSVTDTRVSRWVEDASYVRLKNITLAYTFPGMTTSKLGVKRLRTYVTAANLFTITKYTGYDPEVSSFNSSDARLGVDFGSYPTSRSFIFGIDLSF
ncbi:MAG: TonB-dependent receptor [Chryseolinea sp.]